MGIIDGDAIRVSRAAVVAERLACPSDTAQSLARGLAGTDSAGKARRHGEVEGHRRTDADNG